MNYSNLSYSDRVRYINENKTTNIIYWILSDISGKPNEYFQLVRIRLDLVKSRIYFDANLSLIYSIFELLTSRNVNIESMQLTQLIVELNSFFRKTL